MLKRILNVIRQHYFKYIGHSDNCDKCLTVLSDKMKKEIGG